jgi:hypothetical protein
LLRFKDSNLDGVVLPGKFKSRNSTNGDNLAPALSINQDPPPAAPSGVIKQQSSYQRKSTRQLVQTKASLDEQLGTAKAQAVFGTKLSGSQTALWLNLRFIRSEIESKRGVETQKQEGQLMVHPPSIAGFAERLNEWFGSEDEDSGSGRKPRAVC